VTMPPGVPLWALGSGVCLPGCSPGASRATSSRIEARHAPTIAPYVAPRSTRVARVGCRVRWILPRCRVCSSRPGGFCPGVDLAPVSISTGARVCSTLPRCRVPVSDLLESRCRVPVSPVASATIPGGLWKTLQVERGFPQAVDNLWIPGGGDSGAAVLLSVAMRINIGSGGLQSG
jgi:hypothetical protein